MANKKLAPEVAERVRDLKKQNLSHAEIARLLRISVGSVTNCLHGKEGGNPEVNNDLPQQVNVPIDARDEDGGTTSIVTPDKPLTLEEMAKLFGIDPKLWVALTFKANRWQGFYRIRGTAEHKKVNLWQTSVTWRRVLPKALHEELRAVFANLITPLPRVPARKLPAPTDGCMVSWGLWDTHLGMCAWNREVGESFDLRIAVDRICNSVDDMVAKLQRWPSPIERIVMPIGNDFLHYDNVHQHTTHGDHHLDADGRFSKVYAAGLKCLIYMLDRARELCDDVEVIHVPGNHDETSSGTLCIALGQRYLNDPCVRFDLNPNPRKYRAFGRTLLGFDHGKTNPKQLALIMPTECGALWSASGYREIQVGHVHQKHEHHFMGVTPTNGLTVRVNPALCNVDSWHYSQGLIGEPTKSVEAWVYSRTGYEGSLVAWARDDPSEALKTVSLSRENDRCQMSSSSRRTFLSPSESGAPKAANTASSSSRGTNAKSGSASPVRRRTRA